MKPTILWRKWKNPFLPSTDETEKDDVDAFSFEEEDEHKQPFPLPGGSRYKGPVMSGPWGYFPLEEHNDVSRVFNLWVGHTNFSVTDKVLDAVEQVDGVELLKRLTRYRMWLGIAKHTDFDPEMVKHAVDECVEKLLVKPEKPSPRIITPDDQRDASLALLSGTLAKKYKFWAIVVKGRKVSHFGDQEQGPVKAFVDSCEADKVITSWTKG